MVKRNWNLKTLNMINLLVWKDLNSHWVDMWPFCIPARGFLLEAQNKTLFICLIFLGQVEQNLFDIQPFKLFVALSSVVCKSICDLSIEMLQIIQFPGLLIRWFLMVFFGKVWQLVVTLYNFGVSIRKVLKTSVFLSSPFFDTIVVDGEMSRLLH